MLTVAGLRVSTGLSMALGMRVSPSAGDGDTDHAASFFRQFGALVRKNFLSKRRAKLQLVRQSFALSLSYVHVFGVPILA